MDSRILNVIDEEGNILQEATRQEIHEKGLLHPEIHVWFYTPAGEIVFQHRAKDKDTFPDLLDATVGGHVEIGDSYEETALKEAEEETGVSLDPKNLTLLRTTITKHRDEITGMTNHARRNVYAYRYEGRVEDLKIEEGKSLGFESWSLDKLFNLSEEERKMFIASILEEEGMDIFAQIKTLV